MYLTVITLPLKAGLCVELFIQRICAAVMTSSVVTAIGASHDTGSVMGIRIVLMALMRIQRNVSILLAVQHSSPAW
jgi:hypothetical protein